MEIRIKKDKKIIKVVDVFDEFEILFPWSDFALGEDVILEEKIKRTYSAFLKIDDFQGIVIQKVLSKDELKWIEDFNRKWK